MFVCNSFQVFVTVYNSPFQVLMSVNNLLFPVSVPVYNSQSQIPTFVNKHLTVYSLRREGDCLDSSSHTQSNALRLTPSPHTYLAYAPDDGSPTPHPRRHDDTRHNTSRPLHRHTHTPHSPSFFTRGFRVGDLLPSFFSFLVSFSETPSARHHLQMKGSFSSSL